MPDKSLERQLMKQVAEGSWKKAGSEELEITN